MAQRWEQRKTETGSSGSSESTVDLSLVSLKGDRMKIQIVMSKKVHPARNVPLGRGWFFRIVARNGRTLCHSEIYTTLASCRKTAGMLRGLMVGVGIEEV